MFRRSLHQWAISRAARHEGTTLFDHLRMSYVVLEEAKCEAKSNKGWVEIYLSRLRFRFLLPVNWSSIVKASQMPLGGVRQCLRRRRMYAVDQEDRQNLRPRTAGWKNSGFVQFAKERQQSKSEELAIDWQRTIISTPR